MQFMPHTQEELKSMDINEEEIYTIQYLERDYFNGENRIELGKAKAIIGENEIFFVVTNSYGMDKFIKEARIIK